MEIDYNALVNAAIAIVSVIGGGYFAHARAKMSAFRNLVVTVDDALADNKITADESKRIVSLLRELTVK